MSLLIIFFLLFVTSRTVGYALPPLIGLGTGNFFDGGPLRAKPGIYWQQFGVYYHADKFTDYKGNLLGGVPSPTADALVFVPQFIYISKLEIAKAKLGLDTGLALFAYTHISSNSLSIKDGGNGVGDLVLGTFLQWDTIEFRQRPIFVNRLEFDAFFPTGKNNHQPDTFYPGAGFFYIDPYWSATLYVAPPYFSVSWRLSYLWSAQDPKTKLQAGSALILNYATETLVKSKIWVGINGYFLQQLTNDRLNGTEVPHTKERIFAIGPGALYSIEPDFNSVVIANLYFEMLAQNRTQGIRFIARFIKYF
jgi:hypothetical protein